jgi:uncharacterized membrane protein
MKRRHFLALTMALLLAPLMVSSPVFAADSLEVAVTNRTDANVWIAFGMAAEDEGNFSKGWWEIAPGQTRVIKPFRYTPVYGYYYFAFNPKMNRYWHGKNMPNGTPFLINKNKSFNVRPGQRLPGGVSYVFVPLNERQGKARLTFRLR